MGRTRSASSDDIRIRDYVDALLAEVDKRNEQRFQAQEKAMSAALASADKAVAIQEVNAERWRASANEWRGAMSDRDRELPSRREVESAMAAMEARLRLLEDAARSTQGRSEGIGMSASVVIGAITLIGTVIGIVVVLANVLTS